MLATRALDPAKQFAADADPWCIDEPRLVATWVVAALAKSGAIILATGIVGSRWRGDCLRILNDRHFVCAPCGSRDERKERQQFGSGDSIRHC